MKNGCISQRFDEVFNLQMGKTPDRKNPTLFTGDNTWVSIRDLGNKYISTSNECISDEAAANINLVKKGTVIMSFKLTVGKCAIAAKDLYTNEAIMAFNVKEGYDIDPSFLYYYLQTYNWEGANKAVMGITLNKATISKHKICIPPKSIQLAAVAELDKINKLICLKKEQLSDYDKLAQSIFNEMFGDPVENEKGWKVKKLNTLFKVTSSKRIMQEEWTQEGVPFLKVSDIVSLISTGSIYPSTYISNSKYQELKDNGMVPCENDILITSRGTLGLCYIVKDSDQFYFQDGMVTWLTNSQGDILPLFITRLFDNEHFLSEITGKANKSTVSYISISQISQKEIIAPPLPLQQLFAQRIELIEKQKAQITSTIRNLETLLASRMQFWFDVNEAADAIVNNYYAEKMIEDKYDELYPEGNKSLSINYGECVPCDVNQLDFKALASAYNYILDNGANTFENIDKALYLGIDKAHFCALVELGFIGTEDYKTFNIPQ